MHESDEHIQGDSGHSLCKEISSDSDHPVSYVHCDVSKDSDVEKAVNMTDSLHGKLDVMFSNAGSTGNFDPRIASLYGAFLAAKHAVRVVIPEKKGNILFAASVVSVNHSTSSPYPYTASKYAVLGLTRNVAAELGQYGIRVNSISPFGLRIPLACKGAKVDRETFKEMFSSFSNLKEIEVDETDVAKAAFYLASDESKYASGLNLVVDGGYTLNPVTQKV